MKRFIIASLIMLISSAGWAQKKTALPQPINEQQFVDSIQMIYDSFDDQREQMAALFEQATDTAFIEAIFRQHEALEIRCNNKIFAFCVRYLPVCDFAMEYLYSLRTAVPKTAVEVAYNSLKAKQRKLPYAQLVNAFLNSQQVAINQTAIDFNATTYDNQTFNLKQLTDSKNVVLIFGDAKLMAQNNMQMIQMMYNSIDHSDIEIVYFSTSADNVEAMAKEREQYNMDWNLVSDFKGDWSNARMAYNVQETPTFVCIKKGGLVVDWAVADTEIVINMITK